MKLKQMKEVINPLGMPPDAIHSLADVQSRYDIDSHKKNRQRRTR
jgi:hypothetical protein